MGAKGCKSIAKHNSQDAEHHLGARAQVSGQELREQGFLASDPPPANAGRRLTVSVSALDLRWSGADRLVRAAHDRGVRHLFRPAAVAAQITLAVAGVVALAAAIFSRQPFQLRVSGNSGCNRFRPGKAARAQGSGSAPPTAEPTR